MAIYENQELTAGEIVEIILLAKCFYTLLLAQMQSGKTGTYLKVAIDSIINPSPNSPSSVMIISGSQSRELKNQCIKDRDEAIYLHCGGFDKKEVEGLNLRKLQARAEELKIDEHKIDSIGDHISYSQEGKCEKTIQLIKEKYEENFDTELHWQLTESISVHFGADLNKIKSIPKDTLIIHDESHYAQKKDQTPYKFYKKFKIEQALKGNDHELRKKNIRILSVSATPFCELVSNAKVQDNLYTEEEKVVIKRHNLKLDTKDIIRANPGDNYKGINYFIEHGNLNFTAEPIKQDNHDHISRILTTNSDKYSNKYCIIRTHGAIKNGDAKVVEEIAKNCEYNYIGVFADSKDKALDILEKQPTGQYNKTIIHISGICRMGQVLNKKHIGMVYEQSKGPKSDSILQSLLGRMCGYYDTDVPDIFISKNAEEDMKAYAEYWVNPTGNLPMQPPVKKAMCLSGGDSKHTSKCGNAIRDKSSHYAEGSEDYGKWNENGAWMKIVPIELNLESSLSEPKNDIYNMLNNNRLLLKDNKIDCEAILEILKDPDYRIGKRNGDNGNHDFEENIRNGKRYTSNFTNFIWEGERVTSPLNIIYHGDGKIILYGCVKYDEIKHGSISFNIQSVDKNSNYSVYGVEQEDGSTIEANGGQQIVMPKETSDDIDELIEYMIGAIKRSDQSYTEFYRGAEKSINSIYCANEKRFKGIYLSNVFAKTKKQRNDIESQINDKLEKSVKIVWNDKSVATFKSEGQKVPSGYKGFTSITW